MNIVEQIGQGLNLTPSEPIIRFKKRYQLFIYQQIRNWQYNHYMEIKQIESANPQSARYLDDPSHRRPPSREDSSESSKKFDWKFKQFSKETTETRSTRQESVQLSSLKEEEITLKETTAAKGKIRKLHGRNYGRSLTLEMDGDDLPFLKNKWIWLGVLLVIGLGIIGGVMLMRQNESEVKVKPFKTKGKSRKANK